MERVFSGVQPSGVLHIGNYLGAIKNWLELQNDFQCIFCVVDLHAITVPQEPKELLKKTIEVAKIYLAAGIDPEKSTIFVQSHIKEHAELAWILNCITYLGELSRMTQFKEKSPSKQVEKLKEDATIKDTAEKLKEIEEAILYKFTKTSTGLLNYPVLMAADILLYKTAVVPVGEDQVQHIELARDLAQRFNSRFGEIFVVPKPLVREVGARIMGLDDPTSKMSKSASSAYNYIALTDSPDVIREKIKKAVTDSGKEIIYGPDKPALSNLLTIYSLLVGQSVVEIEQRYQGKNYAEFKNELAEVVVKFLEPFQKKYNALDDSEVLKVLRDGAKKIQPIASQTMVEVKKAMGLVY